MVGVMAGAAGTEWSPTERSSKILPWRPDLDKVPKKSCAFSGAVLLQYTRKKLESVERFLINNLFPHIGFFLAFYEANMSNFEANKITHLAYYRR